MTEKVLVTGGAGFIGHHVVKALLTENYKVVVLDNFSTGMKSNLHAEAGLIEADITDEKIAAIFSEEKFDHVIHLAAQTSVPHSLVFPGEDCRTNIAGSVNIMDACRHNKVKRIVFASSAAVYGDLDAIPLREDAPAHPTSFYGLSKLTVEKYLDIYHKLFSLNYAVLRYANVYGERQGDSGEGGVVSIFARKIKNAQPLEIFGDGGQTRDFIYAGDVAQANCRALSAPEAALNRVYNIGANKQTSVNDLARVLADTAGQKARIVYAAPRQGDIYHSLLDNTSAVKMLGWQPCVDLPGGLKKTYHDLIRRNEN